MVDLALDLRHVAKTYRGRIEALRGIDMRVERGEIFGLLGPNGAGKSTLVKILMTVIRPSRCEGTMLGHAVGHKATLKRVGYLPEHHRFAPYLNARQVLDFYGALCEVPRRDRRGRIPELLELVGLSDWGRTRLGRYSKGMRQRVGVAQALINDPDLVLLDEPTDGVDPVGRRDIRDIVNRLKEQGKTVFINSHLLSELEMVCDRVAILVQGEVAQQGTIEELTADQQRYDIHVASDGSDGARRLQAAIAPLARTGWDRSGPPVGWEQSVRLGSGEPVLVHGDTIRVGATDPGPIQPLIDALRSAGIVIRSIRPHRPSLEDLFMQAVTDPETGQTLSPGAAERGKRGP